MGIITISRGSFSKGVEIAEKLAAKLGYECISREVILETSKEFNIPQAKLRQTVRDATSVFDSIKDGKRKYVAFISKAFLEHIQKDNVVYHGFAGHLFAKDIPNILKVRIIANIEYRVTDLMQKEKLSRDKALRLITKIDEERKKWSQYLYGTDTNAIELFDVVLHVDRLQVNGAVNFLYQLAKLPQYQITEESKSQLKKLLDEAKTYAFNMLPVL